MEDQKDSTETSLVPTGPQPALQKKPVLTGHVALINIDGVTEKNKVQFQVEIQKLHARGIGVAFFSRSALTQTSPQASSSETKTETHPPHQLVPSTTAGAMVAQADMLGVTYQVLPGAKHFEETYHIPPNRIKPRHIIHCLLARSTWDVHYELTGIFIDTKPNASGILKSATTFSGRC